MKRNSFLTLSDSEPKSCCFTPKLTCRWPGRRAVFPSALATEWMEKCSKNHRDRGIAWHLERFVSSEAPGLHLGSEAAISREILASWPW